MGDTNKRLIYYWVMVSKACLFHTCMSDKGMKSFYCY